VKEDVSEVIHLRRESERKLGIKVPCVSLDNFLIKNNIKKIDFIKIDVEGAELKVLRGFKEYFRKKRVGAIILEINEKIIDYSSTAEDLVSFLEGFGYNFYKFSKKGKLIKIKGAGFKFDGTNNFVVLPQG